MWSFFSRDPAKDFSYEIGEPISSSDDRSIWTLHRAKKKGSAGGEDVSVFVFECKSGNEHLLNIARSAVKRLKTLRHPSILAYLDSFETNKVIYLATERVESLYSRLTRKSDNDDEFKKELYFSWGIFQITKVGNGNLVELNI